jgi:hypothetical protein
MVHSPQPTVDTPNVSMPIPNLALPVPDEIGVTVTLSLSANLFEVLTDLVTQTRSALTKRLLACPLSSQPCEI